MPLIDKELLLAGIEKAATTKFDWSESVDVDEFKTILETLPEEDAVKIKHAKWISCKNNSGYKCSNCSARIKNSAYSTGNHVWCYKCGSVMDL